MRGRSLQHTPADFWAHDGLYVGVDLNVVVDQPAQFNCDVGKFGVWLHVGRHATDGRLRNLDAVNTDACRITGSLVPNTHAIRSLCKTHATIFSFHAVMRCQDS